MHQPKDIEWLGEWVKDSESHSVVSDSLWPHGLYSPRSSPGQNTGVVAVPFSRGSSQPRYRTQVSCIADRFFISWVTQEAHCWAELSLNLHILYCPDIFLLSWINWTLYKSQKHLKASPNHVIYTLIQITFFSGCLWVYVYVSVCKYWHK